MLKHYCSTVKSVDYQPVYSAPVAAFQRRNPVKKMTDNIEIYNTSGRDGKTPTVHISMSLEAAREMLTCFEEPDFEESYSYNPRVAKALEKVIWATEEGRNAEVTLKKDVKENG